MGPITQQFFKKTAIPLNNDTEMIVDFLSSPEAVNRMQVVSLIGLPALVGVVQELESRFGNLNGFPLNHDAPNSNAPNRRSIGWIIRYIMKQYGWLPIKSEAFSERTRVGRFSRYFGTAALYEKSIANPAQSISIS